MFPFLAFDGLVSSVVATRAEARRKMLEQRRPLAEIDAAMMPFTDLFGVSVLRPELPSFSAPTRCAYCGLLHTVDIRCVGCGAPR